jgi:hypothetical protein
LQKATSETKVPKQAVCREEPLSIVDPYFEIKVFENATNDLIVCDICLEDDDYEDDEIVICELCNAAAH